MNKYVDFLSNYIRCKQWWLIERDLSEHITDIKPFSESINIHDNIDLAMKYIKDKFYEKELDAGEIAEYECAKEHGHKYLAVTDGDTVIGFVKYGSGDIYIRNMRRRQKFDNNICFIYAVYTDPSYRGKHLFPYVNTKIMERAKKEGYEYIRAQVDVDNKSVIKAFSRCSYYKITNFYTIRIINYDIATANMGNKILKNYQKTPLL